MSARWPIQVFRLATLVVPSALAWDVAFTASSPSQLTSTVTRLLAPLWALTAGALLLRTVDALWRRRQALDPSLLDRIDVLTASGSALCWLGAVAIVASVWVGFASLAVVGSMGLVLVHATVLWTLLRVGGEDPWRRASLSRRFVPGRALEGAAVIEEVRLSGARIPTGFRLFASGRVGPRWATSRYVVEGAQAGGEVVLESDVGPAFRGEHQAEPLEVWLEDVLGLCHSARIRAGAAPLTVLPSPRPTEGARDVLAPGGPDREPRPAPRLPTEGSLRLREYQPGDDARRIHWVRSLTARELVVRLPDELPPDQPAVRLVLDTFFVGAETLSCVEPAKLLDALVEVWLSVARALADAGARVTLVTAEPRGDRVAAGALRLSPRTLVPAQHLGARVRWQGTLRVDDLLTPDPSIVVSFRLPPGSPEGGTARWIVVPAGWWAGEYEPPVRPSPATLPHPIGSPENRWSRRRRERLRIERARRDEVTFARICAGASDHEPPPGSLVARPVGPAGIRLEALR